MSQASPDAGNLKPFSLLAAWPSFPEAAVSLGDFVCAALLLPFVLGFCLSTFFFVV